MSKDSDKHELRLEKLYVVLLASIQFSHIVDFVVLMPLGPIFIREFNITPLQFGGLVSAYNISAAVTGFLYGSIADRFDRKSILIFNFVGFILGTLFCAFAGNYESLIIGRIIAGGFGGTLTSVVYAMVTDLIPFQRRGRAMSVIMSAFSVASVLGVPLGLWIAETFSWRETFIFIVIISIITLVISIFTFPKIITHIEKTNAKENMLRLFRLLLKKKYLKSYGAIFLNVIAIFSLIPYLSPYAVKNIGIHETELKYMYFVAGFFTIITARILGKLTDKYNPLVVLGSVAFLSIFPMYLYTNSGHLELPVFIAMSTLFMTTVSGRMIPLMTIVSEIPDAKDRGTFMGLLNSTRSLGSALATIYAGLFIFDKGTHLEGFNKVGYSSVLLSILLIPFVWHLYGVIQKGKDEKAS